jgi:hypothetical protein
MTPSQYPLGPVSPLPSADQSPAGWYADPYKVAKIRYWSGAAWTGHTSGDLVAPSGVVGHHSRRGWAIAAISVVVVLVILVAGSYLVTKALSGISPSQVSGQLGISDIPPDLPIYPGAVLMTYYSTTGTNGSYTSDLWQTDGNPDEVLAFYSTALSQGKWRLDSADVGHRTVKFHSISGKKGNLNISTQGRHTIIESVLDH